MAFLNRYKGENCHRNNFMNNLNESYVAVLGLELPTSRSAVTHAANCAINLGPVVQSVVSLTSSLVVKMLTVLVNTIFNSLVLLLKKCE